jgi:hypothetical protein
MFAQRIHKRHGDRVLLGNAPFGRVDDREVLDVRVFHRQRVKGQGEDRALFVDVPAEQPPIGHHHPSGFFARWESVWTRQSNQEDVASLSGDNFWQHNVWLGWRFHRRDAEISFGVLNLTGQDYRLHPLNYNQETYRDRTVVLSANFRF